MNKNVVSNTWRTLDIRFNAHFIEHILDNVSCEYLQLDGISEADTELIGFHMLEYPNSNDTSSQEIRLESHIVQKSNLCATSVKVR